MADKRSWARKSVPKRFTQFGKRSPILGGKLNFPALPCFDFALKAKNRLIACNKYSTADLKLPAPVPKILLNPRTQAFVVK